MRAQEMARMSAWSALAMVGSDTMNTRAPTPEMNWPIMALAKSSRSVCAVMPSSLTSMRHRCRGLSGSEEARDPLSGRSDVHPHHAAADQPVGYGLVVQDVALATRQGAEDGQPVADFLTAVAALFLDLVVGEGSQRVPSSVLDGVEHATVECGADVPVAGYADPVREPARAEQGHPLGGRTALDERAHERPQVVHAAGPRQRRGHAVDEHGEDRNRRGRY